MANIGSLFKAAMPYLSAGLSLIPGGGPAVQILSGVASKVLGKDIKPEDLEQTMNNLATSEQGRIQLKQMENDYSKAMQELGFDHEEKLLELGNADRASAREREKTVKDKTPMILAYIYAFGFFAALFAEIVIAVKGVSIDANAMRSIDMLFGMMSAMVIGTKEYYFGSSASSDRKTELLAQAPSIQGDK